MERGANKAVRVEQVQVVAFQADSSELDDIALEICLIAPRATILETACRDGDQSKVVDVTVEVPDGDSPDRVIGAIFRLTSGSRIRVHRDMRVRPLASGAKRAPSGWRDGASSWKQAAATLAYAR
jgi:hypothetical protein